MGLILWIADLHSLDSVDITVRNNGRGTDSWL